MAVENPINATDRTFNTIMAKFDSNAKLRDKPSWFKTAIAGIGDMFSIIVNAAQNYVVLRTSYTRQGTADALALIDYQIGAHSESSGDLIFFVKSDTGTGIFPFTVQKEDLIANSDGNLSVSSKRFEARVDENFALVSDTFTTDFSTDNNLDVSTDFVYTGHKVRLETTGTLPGGLSTGTDYWVIYISATEIRLATSLENANAGIEISLSSNGSGTHTINLFSKAISCFQQETKINIDIGDSDGTTEYQQFTIPDPFFIEGTESIEINSVIWSRVDTFVDSISTDEHYRVLTLSDNQFAIQFGDGVRGKIPGIFTIFASYSFGGGANSNISTINAIKSYGGQNNSLVGVTNPASFTGGADEQSLDQAKVLGPLLLKGRDRFVTTSDGEALALSLGGISLVQVNSNVFGPLSAQIIAIALGGGNPSTAKKNEIDAFLTNRSVLESIDIRVEDATITSVSVTASAKMRPGFTFSSVEPFIDLAFNLFFTETGFEILDTYGSGGVSAAIDLINIIFGASFDSMDTLTSNQIDRLVSNLEPRDFGVSIQESDALGYVDSFVDGVDYLTISSPVFPISLANDEITTQGSHTITEIP